MPPPRRRRVSAPSGGTMGTLLADIRAEQQAADQKAKLEQQAADRAKAEQQAATAQRAKDAVRIVNNYVKDRTMTYDEASSALKSAQATESDPELKSLLADYQSDLKLTKQSREVNNAIDDYTYGRSTYDQLKTALGGMDKSNAVVAEAVSKTLASARATENNRLLSQWQADYQSGNLPYAKYISNLGGLRSAPDQKDPNAISTITQHMDALQQNEQQLQDNKAYVQWQSDQNSGAALQYFNARLAQSKNIKDANSVEQYIKTIQASDQQRGSAQGAATSKALDAVAEGAMKNYEDKTLKTELAAARGDPQAIVTAYARFGRFIGGDVLSLGAPKGQEYRLRLETLPQEAQAAASDAVYKSALDDIARWKKVAEDKTSDPQAVVSAWKKVSSAAAGAETSPWLIAGHRDLISARDEAANKLMEVSREAGSQLAKAQTDTTAELTRLYDGASVVAKKDAKGNFTVEAGKFLKGPMDAGITFDGSGADRTRFADWMLANPQNLPSIERAANVNISTTISPTGTNVTYGDKGEPEQKGGAPRLTLSDLLQKAKDAKALADNASGAMDEAFYPGFSKGRYNQTLPSTNEMAGAKAAARTTRSTPAMDALRKQNDIYAHEGPTQLSPEQLPPPAGDESLTVPKGPTGLLGAAGAVAGAIGAFGGVPGMFARRGAPANTAIPPEPTLPPVQYSEVANYFNQKLHGGLIDFSMPGFAVPSMTLAAPNYGAPSGPAPSQQDYSQGDAPSQQDYSQGDVTPPAPQEFPLEQPFGTGMRMYAQGGVIDEKVIGTGQDTGDTYVFGEKGPEQVSPLPSPSGIPAPETMDLGAIGDHPYKQPMLPGGENFVRAFGNTPEDVSRNSSYPLSDQGLDRISRGEVPFPGSGTQETRGWMAHYFAPNPASLFMTKGGRPTAERLGVSPEMGGAPQERDRTFMSSDELMRAALADMPPAFQRLSGSHIGRPAVHETYGEPSNLGGFYNSSMAPVVRDLPPGYVTKPELGANRHQEIVKTLAPTLNVGRGIEQGSSNVFPAGDRSTAVSTARHELLHAMENTHPAFAREDKGDPSRLKSILDAVSSMKSDKDVGRFVKDARGAADSKDWSHVWTNLAEVAMRRGPGNLPKEMADYFAPLWENPNKK